MYDSIVFRTVSYLLIYRAITIIDFALIILHFFTKRFYPGLHLCYFLRNGFRYLYCNFFPEGDETVGVVMELAGDWSLSGDRLNCLHVAELYAVGRDELAERLAGPVSDKALLADTLLAALAPRFQAFIQVFWFFCSVIRLREPLCGIEQ